MCKYDIKMQSNVETYWNNYHAPPSILDPTDRSAGLSQVTVLFENGLLSCSFRREIKDASLSYKFYDLKDEYYLLTAKNILSDTTSIYFSYSVFKKIRFLFKKELNTKTNNIGNGKIVNTDSSNNIKKQKLY